MEEELAGRPDFLIAKGAVALSDSMIIWQENWRAEAELVEQEIIWVDGLQPDCFQACLPVTAHCWLASAQVECLARVP